MSTMNNTLQYYNEHADCFTADTQTSDMTEKYAPFLSQVKPGGHILDLGCGSGRDSAKFLQLGYTVTSVDGSEELCRIAEAHTGQTVHHMLFDEISWHNEFDGVWACASILHVEKKQLPDIIKKIAIATKKGAVVYTSFKYGQFEGVRNGRFFTYLTKESFGEVLRNVPELVIEKLWISADVRAERGEERWLNIMLRKCV